MKVFGINTKVLSWLSLELEKQDEKWGEDRHQENYTWLAIALEELGESSQAILHDNYGGEHAGTIKKELIQLTCVCLQWLNDIEIQERGSE